MDIIICIHYIHLCVRTVNYNLSHFKECSIVSDYYCHDLKYVPSNYGYLQGDDVYCVAHSSPLPPVTNILPS